MERGRDQRLWTWAAPRVGRRNMVARGTAHLRVLSDAQENVLCVEEDANHGQQGQEENNAATLYHQADLPGGREGGARRAAKR